MYDVGLDIRVYHAEFTDGIGIIDYHDYTDNHIIDIEKYVEIIISYKGYDLLRQKTLEYLNHWRHFYAKRHRDIKSGDFSSFKHYNTYYLNADKTAFISDETQKKYLSDIERKVYQYDDYIDNVNQLDDRQLVSFIVSENNLLYGMTDVLPVYFNPLREDTEEVIYWRENNILDMAVARACGKKKKEDSFRPRIENEDVVIIDNECFKKIISHLERMKKQKQYIIKESQIQTTINELNDVIDKDKIYIYSVSY